MCNLIKDIESFMRSAVQGRPAIPCSGLGKKKNDVSAGYFWLCVKLVELKLLIIRLCRVGAILVDSIYTLILNKTYKTSYAK